MPEKKTRKPRDKFLNISDLARECKIARTTAHNVTLKLKAKKKNKMGHSLYSLREFKETLDNRPGFKEKKEASKKTTSVDYNEARANKTDIEYQTKKLDLEIKRGEWIQRTKHESICLKVGTKACARLQRMPKEESGKFVGLKQEENMIILQAVVDEVCEIIGGLYESVEKSLAEEG